MKCNKDMLRQTIIDFISANSQQSNFKGYALGRRKVFLCRGLRSNNDFLYNIQKEGANEVVNSNN